MEWCRGGASKQRSASLPRGCVLVRHAAFEAEQILLHGEHAQADLTPLMEILNHTRDPSDVFSKLRPYDRLTALVATPGRPYEYLPIAVGAKRAARSKNRWIQTHTPSNCSQGFSLHTAVAFFTSWSNSFTEIFSRAVTRLFDVWCLLGADRDQTRLIPAMWGSSWGPDYAKYWLSPFTSHPVEPMAQTPPRELVKLIWRALATREQYARYRNLSNAMFARRQQENLLASNDLLSPCTTAAARRRLGALAIECHGCLLATRTFANATVGHPSLSMGVRAQQQRLHPKWRELALRVTLNRSLDQEERYMDVFIVPHGADIINGFAMHAGASVIEVMPVHRYGCPCDMYKRLFAYQGPAVFHYQMESTNSSNAVSTEARKKGTYNSDLFLPWPSLRAALTHVLHTDGRRANYRFRSFTF
ncbi:hypothetical protein AB1Y20_005112 [Prymnesium parvum]|uniref:Uncharacterized protein n=1 Tax=Prymnesium parvum TaxID=97485 RepID=A0AB34J3A7_PRYPA